MHNFSEQEREFLRLLQGDLPVTSTPIGDVARRAGISEEQALSLMETLHSQGIIKRVGVLLGHQLSGFGANMMVVWEIPAAVVAAAGRLMASKKEVSHCYEREPAFEGRFNFFTMIHLREMRGGDEFIANFAKEIGALDYQILHSKKELKKTSREYF